MYIIIYVTRISLSWNEWNIYIFIYLFSLRTQACFSSSAAGGKREYEVTYDVSENVALA